MIPALLAAALIWLPPETFTQWSRLDALLRARSDLKLTVALTPEMATPAAKAALAPWIASGRVEVAARAHGDPVLPLTAAHPAAPRPDDALEIPAEARQAVERNLGTAVAGFAPGDGALEASLIGPIGASGAGWVLTGGYDVAVASWAVEGRAVFVPARKFSTAELTAPGADVLDESAETESRALEALAALPRGEHPERGWTTVAGLIKEAGAGASASGVGVWPGWDGSVAAAPTDPAARAAWEAYGDAARALARYQNSGAADLKVLESATESLRKAQEARFFRAPPAGAPSGLPPELRARLLAVYKRVKSPAPESLYGPGASAATAAELPTGVHAASGPNWVQFNNPAGTLAKAPAGAANADPWRLRGLRVDWDDEQTVFRVLAARVDAVPAAPRPVYDVYVDLNHVAGAGAIRTLDGRGVFIQARDAWEFALSVVGAEARLWRAGASGPEEIGRFKAELDAANAEVRVAVPRALVRGNPARWGYVLLAAAEDPARPGASPAPILVGADGSQALGLLAPLEVQKTVADHPGSPQRVAAARLEPSRP